MSTREITKEKCPQCGNVAKFNYDHLLIRFYVYVCWKCGTTFKIPRVI